MMVSCKSYNRLGWISWLMTVNLWNQKVYVGDTDITDIKESKSRIRLKTKDWKNLWWFLLSKFGGLLTTKLWNQTVYFSDIYKEWDKTYGELKTEKWENLWRFLLDNYRDLITKRLWERTVYVTDMDKKEDKVRFRVKTKEWEDLWWFNENEIQ